MGRQCWDRWDIYIDIYKQTESKTQVAGRFGHRLYKTTFRELLGSNSTLFFRVYVKQCGCFQ